MLGAEYQIVAGINYRCRPLQSSKIIFTVLYLSRILVEISKSVNGVHWCSTYLVVGKYYIYSTNWSI